MPIAVLGAGSVGLGIAATLLKAGADVTLLARRASLPALTGKPLKVTGVCGEHVIDAKDFALRSTDDPPADADLLIVTTKTYEVVPALKTLQPLFKTGKSPALLLLQNGWGSAAEAKACVPAGTAIFSGSVMVGLERLAPGQVRINAYVDGVKTGSLFGDDLGLLKDFFALSCRGFIPFTAEPAIEPVMLGKLLYNICLNPLGALLRCSYGNLLTNDHTLSLIKNMAEEAIRTLAAARNYTRFQSGASYVEDVLVGTYLAKIAAHRSSMLQDLEGGRRTEIDYLNGALVAMGRTHGVDTPVNETLTLLIGAAEKKIAA